MKTWLYLIILGVALLVLAVGGWIVEGFMSVAKPSAASSSHSWPKRGSAPEPWHLWQPVSFAVNRFGRSAHVPAAHVTPTPEPPQRRRSGACPPRFRHLALGPFA
jgi:hypothetical protein